MEVVFLCVVVTKGAQFDQFDWLRTFRSQVSIYNNRYQTTSECKVNQPVERRLLEAETQRSKYRESLVSYVTQPLLHDDSSADDDYIGHVVVTMEKVMNINYNYGFGYFLFLYSRGV